MKEASLLKELKKYLSYDTETGVFTWIKKTGTRAPIGKIAEYKDKKGYVVIKFNKKQYRAHRLAWLFTFGKWPENDIDHINGNKHDNRICNLRDVSRRENLQNTEMHRNGRLVGASFHKKNKKWISRIKINKKTTHLGYFKTEQEAHDAYIKALKRLVNLPKLANACEAQK